MYTCMQVPPSYVCLHANYTRLNHLVYKLRFCLWAELGQHRSNVAMGKSRSVVQGMYCSCLHGRYK